MTPIKICGITRLEDAEAAVALGVHAVGFVLWPASPRHVDLAQVSRIVSALPPFVTPVGVFVNPSAEHIALAASAGVRVAQVHGELPMWEGNRGPLPILRAVHLVSGDTPRIEPDAAPGSTVLLDTHDPVRHGGTGQPVEWARAKAVAAVRRVVLAGGLTALNVAEAIRIVRPYAVDVASGVESSPGVKDHRRLREFVEAVKETM